MNKKSSLSAELDSFISPFLVDGSDKFHLKSHKTNEKGGLDKDEAEGILEANRKRLSDFQEKLYAQDRWSLLLIFQGMDAAGKDSAIKAIFDGVNPQGCEVTSFKQPTSHELDHDFMWRSVIALPDRHLQPLLLRGMPGDAGPSRNSAQGKNPAEADDQEHLERALRGHHGL
jgi:polyphosphate kinase 2 (PPK2 family)